MWKDEFHVIDFHSHILPGVDDGAKDLETSLQMLSHMINHGVDTFVEIGLGKTLTGFIKKIAKAMDKEVTTYNVEKYEDVEVVVEALA